MSTCEVLCVGQSLWGEKDGQSLRLPVQKCPCSGQVDRRTHSEESRAMGKPFNGSINKILRDYRRLRIQSNREDVGSRLEKAALPWASRHSTPSRPSLSSCLCEMGPLCPSCFPRDGYMAVLQGRSEPFHPLHLLAVSFIVIFPLSHTHTQLFLASTFSLFPY